MAAEPGPKDDPGVEAIVRAVRELVQKRDRWLNPEGATEEELKKRTLTSRYNQRPTRMGAWEAADLSLRIPQSAIGIRRLRLAARRERRRDPGAVAEAQSETRRRVSRSDLA